MEDKTAAENTQPKIKLKLDKGGAIFSLNKFIWLAFGIASAIMAISFFLNKVWPFGNHNVLAIDCYHMYATFVMKLHDIFFKGQSFIFTWDSGMGMNYFSFWATNVGSPLNMLAALFPKQIIPDMLGLAIVLRVGLSAMFASLYLRYKFKRCDYSTVAFSLMYALCAYVAIYYWNIMWTDLVYLLPLMLIGIEEIINHKKIGIYAITLAFGIICSYYIAFLICIVLVLYFIAAAIIRYKITESPGKILRAALLFAGASVLAACIGGIVIIPTFFSITNTTALSGSLPNTIKTYYAMLEIFTNHLPGYVTSFRSGNLPNIYCGFLVCALIPVYIACKHISLRERVMNIIVCIVMILGMNINTLDFIWHGMHSTNDLPFRFAFAYSFMIVAMSYHAFTYIDRISKKFLAGTAFGLVLYVLFVEAMYRSKNNNKAIILSLALLLAYGVIWFLYTRRFVGKTGLSIAILCVVCFEMGFGTTSGIAYIGTAVHDLYVKDIKGIEELVDKTYTDDPGFYRMEEEYARTLNNGNIYGYRGLGHFSSLLGSSFDDAIHHLGYPGYFYGDFKSNRVIYKMNTPFADSLISLKYLMTKNKIINKAYWEPVQETDEGYGLYRNDNALPIAFLMNSDAAENFAGLTGMPFDNQNSLAQLATGINEPLFIPVEIANKTDYGVTLTTETAEGDYYFKDASTSTHGNITCSYIVPDNSPLYGLIDSTQLTDATYTFDEQTGSVDSSYPGVFNLGRVTPGSTVTLTATVGRDRTEAAVTMRLYRLDERVFEKVMAKLAAGAMTDITFDDTFVKGTVDAQENTFLFTSIPYDTNWHAYVDGTEVETRKAVTGFVGVDLAPGRHNVEFRYVLKGLNSGIALSVCGIIILIGFILFKKRKAAAIKSEMTE